MTNKLEKLTELLADKTLSFGCRVKYKDVIRTIYADKKNRQWWLCFENKYPERFKKYLIQTKEGNFGIGDGEYADYENNIEILGHPITLERVLMKMPEKYLITERSENGGTIIHPKLDSLLTLWEFGKPLSEQKPEVIDFLFEIFFNQK